jgi:hypothetical protein|tara:strand:- start:1681 stop:2901 length:1221 start_codon:yes stop_codon:yes gene_type:complete
MGDLTPIGSEKLTGQDKIKRIMEIARYGETVKNTENHIKTNSFIKEGKDGMTYAIVRELDGYYIKTGINESELDYANGLRNKKKNRFKSYSAALKRMNLIFKPLNEEYNDGKSDTMYEQYTEKVSVEEVYEDEEVTEGEDEEEVDEQEKFVLNVPDDGGDEDMGDEELDMDMEDDELDMEDDEIDMEDDEMDMEDEEVGDEEEGEEEMEGYMKSIQKLTGKLGQKLRDSEEELDSEDIKYVINSVLSAVDLNTLEEEDKEDIVSRFEEDETEYGDEEAGDEIEMDDEDLDIDMEDEDMDMGDEELDMDMEDEGEIAMESLKKRIGTLLESYTEKKSPEKYIKSRLKKNKLNSLIEKHSSSVEQELSVKKYIKENKNTSINGKNKNGSLVLTNGDKKILINKSGVVK